MNRNLMLYNAIKKAYKSKQPLDSQIHELAMEQVYKYLLVGGMPEAVEAYVDGDNLLETREILKVLYDNYLADMELYQQLLLYTEGRKDYRLDGSGWDSLLYDQSSRRNRFCR